MYARQGELRKAQEHAVQALRDSEEAGNLVGIGLSLNVLARIELAREHPRSALAYSQRALKLFVQAEDIRDQGLAHITIGQAHRKIVGLGLWALKEKKVDSTMRDSLKHLESAKDVFEKKFEPSRLVDVLVQRGCTWRDWATFYRLRGIKSLKVDEMVTNAQKDLEEAVKLAQREKLVAESADAKNDQAEIYFHAGDFDRACQLLDESDSLITADYFINKGKGIPTPSGKTISGFWQILGKNYLVRGRIAFARQQYETAMEQYLLSYLYFQKYSAKPPEFAVRESVANELEKNLDHLPFPKTEILEQLGEYVKKTAEEYHVIDEAATHQILAILEAVRSKEMR
jgi:tetratricopeptide (TPR) repeat protein